MNCLAVPCIVILSTLLSTHVHCFSFTLLHNNDMHARYDPVTNSCGKCPQGDDERGLCFGGFARIATVVTTARAKGSTIYLNAGDTFSGTNWHRVFGGDLAAELLNLLKPDAVSIGNHELDEDLPGFIPYLKRANFPIVCCNLNLRMTPELNNFRSLVRSTIIRKFKQNIGIIGYITPNTKYYVPYNSIGYFAEIPSINIEARKLRSQGVNIIIALGHSGFEMDKIIALRCTDVDVVIGGHSHTFLYTGSPPDIEKPEGNYPTIVTKPNGHQVPVLQAYAFTKYMGVINLVW
ncbi:protein 5NUC-like isoform X2 [Drosophila hydei]|uniref:5'-nucleotidase n=1 Tax=Drosophila hydei TaxID=7224 RepID=A0A6J2T1L1_DROHY|nr:protein 5NUC-like isoform X2 [Drosophila hydei]